MRIQWTDLKTFDIIGSGSFGRVFHGELLGTEVAIKECVRSNSRAFDEKYFRREVDILKESRHPNIVQFMGICKRKKRVYIITEFLPLGNLRRWIQDETKEFGWDTRISFAIDISLALAYLHHKNIIHRDLKGENLLISENMRIKVCDFGFSRVEAKDDNEMRRISYCGTDGYMAPEILLGEDFDCSVDVFSFGIVLAEMMARHVVDPQHFQRLSPDFSVSSDEILFRAQEGCPVELGELAIHCVQPQPRNRPKLRQIVERLTAIENVDIHVGTTLVVAPSVARAARNIMRNKDVEARKLQQQQQKELGRMDMCPIGLQPHQAYLEESSSIRGVANTWRMTDEENASSLRAESSVVGSQSTFKGRRWAKDGSSAIPLVLEAQRRARDQSNNDDDHDQSMPGRDDSYGGDTEDAFRMPLWDSINSPQNQQQLREWNESESVRISTVDGTPSLQSWDQEHHRNVGDDELSQLSSIQIGLHDRDDEDDNYSFGSGASSDEDDDYLYDDDNDRETESRIHGQPMSAYELSSDSGDSLSSASLTESVVLALDTLEIPDHLTKNALQRPLDTTSPENSQVRAPEVMQGVEGAAARPLNGESKTTVFRKPSLISRLLPPIPISENPWTSDTALNGDLAHVEKSVGLPRATTQYANDSISKETPLLLEDTSEPPAPPSKSSLLLRTGTLKSAPQPKSVADLASLGKRELNNSATTQSSAGISLPTSEQSSLSALDSAPTSTATSESSSSSVSSSSSTTGDLVQKLDGVNQKNTFPQRGFGLIRGMSDSVLEGTSLALESGGTITSNLIAAMNAKTWTNGWIGQYTQQEDSIGRPPLKKHTSLKEGKQQQAMMISKAGISNLDEFVQEEDDEPTEQREKQEPYQVEPMAAVRRRATKTLTGFPHRFSLVVFSTQLLPKCDVCHKRLGVLPGWSAKHLECDDCGYKTHPKCVPNVVKCCTSARKSGVWDIPV